MMQLSVTMHRAHAILAGPPGPRGDVSTRLRRAIRAVLVTATFAPGLSCSDAATGPEPPGSVAASSEALSLEPLDTVRVQATVTRADGSLSPAAVLAWRSLDTTIARVDARGLVTAMSYAGPQVRATVIEVSSPGAVPDSVRTEVRPWPVRRVRIALDTVTVSPRDSATVAVATENERGLPLAERDVAWFSSDTAALQALPGGKLRARPYTGPLRRTVVASAWSEGRADSIVVVIPPLAVAVIEAQRDSVTLQPGAIDTIRVVARGAGGDVLQAPPLRWRTTDSTIVRTNAEGILTASFYAGAAIRTARVIVEGGTAADTIAVRVTPLPVARIVLRPDSGRVVPGATLLLDAQAQDAGGVVLEQRPVAWRSSDTTVATVSASGQVTAQPYGGTATRSAKIIASAGPAADTLPLVVAPHPVRWVTATPEALSLRPLDTATVVVALAALDLTPLTDRPVTWTSLDTTVATVTAAGRITVRAYAGPQRRTTALVAASEASADTVPLEVLPIAVARVAAGLDTALLRPRDSLVLTATPLSAAGTPLTGRAVAWIGGDTTVATVSPDGLLRTRPYAGPAERRTTALVFSEGRADTVVVVVPPHAPATLVLARDTVTVNPGGGSTPGAVVRAAAGDTLTGRMLTWTAADTTIARVSADGVVTATFYAGAATRTTRVTVVLGALADTLVVVVPPLGPASVQVVPDVGQLSPGATFQLDVTVRDGAGTFLTGRPVSWTSLDPVVATVSGSGLVTAAADGGAVARVARVVASVVTNVGTLADTALLTVAPHTVAWLSATPEALSLLPMDSATLVPTLLASDLTVLRDRPVTYESRDGAVATVTAAGRVVAADHRGPQVRTTQVLVRSGAAVDTVPVEVRPLAVARVSATPVTVALSPRDTVALALQLEAADGRVLTGRTTLWQSTDTTVVRVTSEGRAIGAAYGGTAIRTAEIVVFSEGVADTVAVTVTPLPPASITITPDSASIIPGEQRTLAATVRAARGDTLTGRSLTWTSSDTTIARVNADGIVTATFYVGGAERVAGIVSATGTVADTAPVRVRPLAVAQATVFPDTQTLTPNRTAQLDVVLRDSAGTFLTGRTVTWASLDTAFASVSATGLVRTRRAGTARITASAGTGLDTVSVTIVYPARALRLTPSLATVWIGRSQALVLEIRDSAGTLLTDRFVEWTSSNPAAASVSPAGVVSGVSQGTAVITATVEGLVATMTVDVFPEPSAAITITFDDAWRGVLQLAAPMLDTLRLRANVGWITNVDWSGVMTPPELRQLQDRGWSILSHTMTHARLTSLTPDSAAAEISRSRARIDSLGFDPRVFIVPYLDYSPAVLAASAAAGYQYTRCCAQDVWSPDTLVAWPIAPAARHRLAGVDVTNYDGLPSSYNFRTAAGRTALRTLLEQVVAQGKFVDVFFHDIVPDDVADLRLTLQILAEFRPYLVTYAALP